MFRKAFWDVRCSNFPESAECSEQESVTPASGDSSSPGVVTLLANTAEDEEVRRWGRDEVLRKEREEGREGRRERRGRVLRKVAREMLRPG